MRGPQQCGCLGAVTQIAKANCDEKLISSNQSHFRILLRLGLHYDHLSYFTALAYPPQPFTRGPVCKRLPPPAPPASSGRNAFHSNECRANTMHLALNHNIIGKTTIFLRRNHLIESSSMGLPPPALTGCNAFHSSESTTTNTDFLLYMARTTAKYETQSIQNDGHTSGATHTSAHNQIRGPHAHAGLIFLILLRPQGVDFRVWIPFPPENCFKSLDSARG